MTRALAITFLTQSGGKKTMKFGDAKMSQDPIAVKALGNFIVTNNPFTDKDPLVAIEKAQLEMLTVVDVDLD